MAQPLTPMDHSLPPSDKATMVGGSYSSVMTLPGSAVPFKHSDRGRCLIALVTLSVAAAFGSGAAPAGPVYQPPGANLTYGDVSHGHRVSSAAGNPAAGAADVARLGDQEDPPRFGMVVSGVGGIEYGNLDEFYRRVDEIATAIKPPPEDGGDPGPENPIYPPGGGISIGDIIEICCPNFAAIIDRVKTEVGTRAALLTLIGVDGYAKVFASADVPLLVSEEMLGGTWSFGLNWSGAAKAYGIADTKIEFDAAAALDDLASQYELMAGDPETAFDIVGDVDIVIDPASGRVRAFIDNDSTLLTKASKTTELSVSYSRKATELANGTLFLGAEGKLYDLRLSRIGFRFGNITDTEELFDAIRDSNFISDIGAGLDVGALWVAPRYQVGATITNLNEPKFIYPDIDERGYTDEFVIRRLFRDRRYKMERQIKLEASAFSPNRRWGLNFGIDTNAVEDPMGDDFQWLTVSGGWTSNNKWFNNARFGYRRNLAGSKLDYLGAGVTAFKWFNIDLAVELQRVEIKDDTLPRGLLLSMGFQFDF